MAEGSFGLKVNNDAFYTVRQTASMMFTSSKRTGQENYILMQAIYYQIAGMFVCKHTTKTQQIVG